MIARALHYLLPPPARLRIRLAVAWGIRAPRTVAAGAIPPMATAAGAVSVWIAAILALAAGAAVAAGPAQSPDSVNAPVRRSQQEVMAALGFVRYRGAWRTVQEIELIERAERTNVAQKEWAVRLERLRRQCDQPARAGRAAEEIRGVSDAFAVPALAAAIVREESFAVRGLYVEALGRIGSGEAVAALVSTATDHPDRETRIAAIDRIAAVGRHQAVAGLVAALGSPDNARVNRAAEALGRLGEVSAVAPLIAALETMHVAVVGDGGPEGSTTATFTPAGGGLSMGGGRKRVSVPVRNERVLESLVTLTGANFGWDAAAWRAWLAARQSPADFDPRRG